MPIADKLKELGIELPPAPAAAANYVPYVLEGGLLFVAGQVPLGPDGKLHYVGKVGADASEQQGYQSARLCALNALAQINAALGSLDKVKRVLSLRGFVNCTDGFTNQPEVINGASDLLVEVFGEQGRHARAAVGSNALPRGVMTEVEVLVAVV
ncbi:MAG: RidA family protein [SAR324 cluster bacterium]|nr:RidA family protein [SAR324 cluster bacterium]